ncbi:MAG TPA: ABC transporter ATP-binding protein, partial [Blastocatellia bacterium]|nr:ABC transporter ATP-binding protein [Blastocatellia bacterium]
VAGSAIAVTGLTKRFGPQSVLAGINLTVGKGELLVVLGPSGSGKTTLLRIISGLTRPEAGDVFLSGQRITDMPPQDRRIGVVFQEHALFRHMTVEENIAFGLRVRKLDAAQIREAVGDMLDLVHLQGHASKYPSQLSGGQRQRVGLARALAPRPDALLFDEPFSAVDAVTRTELRRDVKQLLRSMGVAALFITHDQEEALELGDRIAILNEGQIQQLGTPYDVYNHPSNEFVATFLGAANVLLGRWGEGRVTFGGLELKPPVDAPVLSERQPVKIVFRPEDVVLNFEPSLLDTPFYLGHGIVEDLFYVGPSERLTVRLALWGGAKERGTGAAAPDSSDGFPITVSRSKWDATEMELSPGDRVVVGLKDYRILPHFPLRSDSSGNVVYI